MSEPKVAMTDDPRITQARERHERLMLRLEGMTDAERVQFSDVGDLLDALAEREQEIARLEGEADAWRDINKRSDEARAYCQAHLMPAAWGENVWHAILDDVLKLRKALALSAKRRRSNE